MYIYIHVCIYTYLYIYTIETLHPSPQTPNTLYLPYALTIPPQRGPHSERSPIQLDSFSLFMVLTWSLNPRIPGVLWTP